MKATTISIQTTGGVRFIVAAAMALVLGLMLVQGANAEPRKPQSQSQSIQNQRDMCETVGGGTLEVTDSPFSGIKISECKGGTEDGTRCAHGKKTTNCTYPKRIQVEEEIEVGDGQIVGSENTGGSVSPIEETHVDISSNSGVSADVSQSDEEAFTLLPLDADSAAP